MGMSVTIATAGEDDAEQILKLQYLCYQGEAELYGDYSIAPLTQSLAALRAELAAGCVLVARLGDEVVGSVRASVDGDGVATLAALIVHPRLRRHGLGGRLLAALEDRLAADHAARRFRLSVGRRSEVALRLCRGRGYARTGSAEAGPIKLITLEKAVAERAYVTAAG
ncbi:GNAT family N-acetyltransferase [Streptomyces sp. AV19]|uniref:GNAT family N-acetyltransferase n=1 Tax=Streptomyces sp. AV19 TaxID=2793068 RepID=UPI0018FE5809|nr:GNAT family N-acetyltransferase [Streptomyces sp. AV19]MBH1936780.1 GNAT family N-acetyltransferase [Streptomyces sp. AV19]MDG4532835.1 GNAT family N-acetyltransferase [Streptomyces sp. AV19]